MTKYERIAMWTVAAMVAILFIYMLLPPMAWAVIALLLAAYGVCEMAERAIRRAWRRR